MSTEASILARLAAIEQQNQQVLILLAKLAGASVEPPQQEGGMTVARRMELRQLAFEIVRSPRRTRNKKSSNREARV